ncbi:hypothetical protein KFE25_003756 [Diacronema lutheri]|uniref:Homoserine dehydrogenase n=2 Tax=Diacronema lutheri TaxID=2081491 RepID=A0A8J5X3P0_DIALT|nr:hypothetical protein KFE25_003756 [Diacronema lutheri]
MARKANFALIGTGGVGRALLESILASREHHASTYGVWFNACLLADSTGAIALPSISDAKLRLALDAKRSGRALRSLAEQTDGVRAREPSESASDFLATLVGELEPESIIVDCTATEDTIVALRRAVGAGQRIVCANKKPFSSSQAIYDALIGSPRALHAVRHESTVGAGLPVIAALSRLLGANDPVSKIAGTFSGTLGFVMTGLQAGRAFSEIVLEAKALGYTEPDPRDDLGGVDVARKALILARGMGWRLELSDVAVTPLYPPDFAALSVDEFLARLPELNASFAAQASECARKGEALRYAALIEGGKLVVGPQSVPLSSPLGSLSGTDNLVEFYTQWYASSPLVVRGAGAGAGTTAAGVLADMVELAFAATPDFRPRIRPDVHADLE